MFSDVIVDGDDIAAWKLRRDSIRSRVLASMGDDPAPDFPGKLRWGETREIFGVESRDFSLEILPRYHCAGTVCFPEKSSSGDNHLIFCIHGCTLPGRRNVLDPKMFPNRCYGIELARQGFITCSLDLFGFGDWLKEGGSTAECHEGFYRDFPDWSLDGIYLKTFRLAMDHLSRIPELKNSRFGAIGHSLGGRAAIYLAALEERLSVAVASAGVSTNLTNVFRNFPGHPPQYSPKLNADTVLRGKPPWEYQELIALAAPRSLLIVEPYNDNCNPFPFTAAECFDRARRVWEIAGAPERFGFLSHGMGHDVPPLIRNFSYNFLREHLEDNHE